MTHFETTLGALFPDAQADSDGWVTGLAADSRAVEPGFAFVAVPGTKADGSAFVPDAIARGAGAVVGEGARPPSVPDGIPYLQVSDTRRSLALAAARRHPRQPETVVAVTGTSGKSSVAEFTRQLCQALGHESASLGTIGIVTAKGADYGSLTTPDPITLHRNIDRLARDGITHLAMEASSHGLDQRRLDGVRLAAAAFTNLGRDHLDYHASVEDYLDAKLRLFRDLLPAGSPVVVNLDGPEGARVAGDAARSGHRVLSVGRDGDFIRLVSTERAGFAQRLHLRIDGHDYETDLPLVGGFQVENALVAAALVLATEERHAEKHTTSASQAPESLTGNGKLSGRHAEEHPEGASRSTHDRGASFETPAAQAPQDDEVGSFPSGFEGGGRDSMVRRLVSALSTLRGVPGRLDRVGEVNGALCVVDYAHKPEALAAVLDALRPFATGRLVCVFGCGGDRDRGKRPLMGAIAAGKADVVIVTDDNPRSEEPGAIRAAILAAAPGAREIGDRREAVRKAVSELQPGDVLVVAGKGHETGQIISGTTYPFSDHDEIRAAMEARA